MPQGAIDLRMISVVGSTPIRSTKQLRKGNLIGDQNRLDAR